MMFSEREKNVVCEKRAKVKISQKNNNHIFQISYLSLKYKKSLSFECETH